MTQAKNPTRIERYAKQKSRIEMISVIVAIIPPLAVLGLYLLGGSQDLSPLYYAVPLGMFLGLLVYYFLLYRLDRKFELTTSWRSYVSFNLKSLLILFSFSLLLIPLGFILAEYVRKIDLVVQRAIGYVFASIWGVFVLPRLFLWIFEPRGIEDRKLASAVRNLGKRMGIEVQGVMRIPTPRLARVNAVQVGCLWGNRFAFLIGNWDRDFTPREILAVIGHELAHAKFHHLAKHMAAYGAEVLYLLLAWLPFLLVPSLKQQRMLSLPPTQRLIIVVGIGIPVVVGWFFLSCKIFAFFRQTELEADVESAKICGAEAMISALQKLAQRNLIPKEKSHFPATHPSIQKRVENLREKFP